MLDPNEEEIVEQSAGIDWITGGICKACSHVFHHRRVGGKEPMLTWIVGWISSFVPLIEPLVGFRHSGFEGGRGISIGLKGLALLDAD
jgi:hypothetical protein